MQRFMPVLGAIALALLVTAAVGTTSSDRTFPDDTARGKYLVMIAGCNDCHTPGYMMSAGNVDEKTWLTGAPLGWQGPWGTTYAANLRLLVPKMTADQFMAHARSDQRRPPMPWFAVQRHDRRRRQGDLRVHQASRPRRPTRPGLRAARRESRGARCSVPRAAQVKR